MKKPLQSLPHLEVFVGAAESLSFTKAAQQLGLTPAGISRAIGNLEQRLGVSLFKRTTRSVALTEEGQLLFERASHMLIELSDVEEGLRGNQTELRGSLRISAPTTYGHFRLLKVLPKFAEAHPKLDLQISISNRNINLVDDGFDAAIRMGELADSRLVSRKLEDAPVGFYASPAYLKKHGTPQHIEDLNAHTCAAFILPSTGKPIPWLYRVKGEDRQWVPKAYVAIEDDVLGCLNYCIAGGGICQMLSFTAEDAVKQRKLVSVLERFAGATRPFSLIYRRNTLVSPKIKALSSFLAKAA